MFAPKQLLVPTDFSDYSEKALELAIHIARQNNGRIYLLHVIPIVDVCRNDYCFDKPTVDRLEQNSINSAKQMIEKQIAKHPDSASVEIVPEVKEGAAYDEILKEEQARKVDLIVIASHGKTGFVHHLLGCVAERVMKGAKGPVLLVR